MAIYQSKTNFIAKMVFKMLLATSFSLLDSVILNDTENRIFVERSGQVPNLFVVRKSSNYHNHESGFNEIIQQLPRPFLTENNRKITTISDVSGSKNEATDPLCIRTVDGKGVRSGLATPRNHDSEVSSSKNERNILSHSLKTNITFRTSKLTEWNKKPIAGSKSAPAYSLTSDPKTDGNVPTSAADRQMDECFNSIVTLEQNEYEVWNNFSVSYKNIVYDFNQYRVSNGSIQVCNPPDAKVQGRWRAQNVQR